MPAETLPLTDLALGERACVTELSGFYDAPAAHLVAVGVLPGTELTLLQRYPAFVFRVGNTEFAVDEGLARRIRVGKRR
ncbi:MAG: ferrous iron transport protein A [Gemmatimonadetes bacterium]|nr:ferrous iron transport protein A [Gemmatimonadota bacterium]